MKKHFLLISILFITASCSHPQDGEPIKGFASLVDTIKKLFGFQKSEPAAPQPAAITTPPPAQVTPQATVAVPAAPPQPTIPTLDDRLKTYRDLETKMMDEENKKIEDIESETNKQIEELMKDSRVVEMTQKNPEINFEELPHDIHKQATDLIDREEKRITDIMDETDNALLEEAKSLGIHEHIAQEEANRGTERQKKLEEIKKAGKAPAQPTTQPPQAPAAQEGQAPAPAQTQPVQG